MLGEDDRKGTEPPAELLRINQGREVEAYGRMCLTEYNIPLWRTLLILGSNFAAFLVTDFGYYFRSL
jgi:hypothetical protein